MFNRSFDRYVICPLRRDRWDTVYTYNTVIVQLADGSNARIGEIMKIVI